MFRPLLFSWLLLLSAYASGAVVADPNPLVGSHGDWAQVLNDDLVGKSPDDNLTAGFHGGLDVLAVGMRVGWEYDLYTDRMDGYRNDKLSGLICQDFTDDANDYRLTLGVGAAWSGKAGGQTIQTTWHKLTNVAPVELKYEPSAWRPLALADYRYFIQCANVMGVTPNLRLETDSRSATVDVLCQFWFRNFVGSSEAEYFIAPRYTHTFGHLPTRSEQKTSNFYNETAIVLGVQSAPFLVDFNIGMKGSYGEIGFIF